MHDRRVINRFLPEWRRLHEIAVAPHSVMKGSDRERLRTLTSNIKWELNFASSTAMAACVRDGIYRTRDLEADHLIDRWEKATTVRQRQDIRTKLVNLVDSCSQPMQEYIWSMFNPPTAT